MQCWLKSSQNSSKVFVKEFIFNTVVGLHVVSLLKNVTYSSEVFYQTIAPRFWEHLFLTQPLNECFPQNNAKSLNKT